MWIETAVKALHFEKRNLNNADKNASTVANNIANQGVEDRDRCGKVNLEFIPCSV